MKRISIAVVAVIIAAAAVWGGMKLWKNNSKENALSFKLEKISRNN